MDWTLNDEVHLSADGVLEDYIILGQIDLASQGKAELFDQVFTAEIFKHWLEKLFFSLKDDLLYNTLRQLLQKFNGIKHAWLLILIELISKILLNSFLLMFRYFEDFHKLF